MNYPLRWYAGIGAAAAGLVGALYLAGAAKAADLGSCGCGDLEERVAELEATTARKGNRKVTLTISGQVSKAILWTDGLDGFEANHKARVIDNGNSSTAVRLEGTAKISPTTSAGFIFEYAFDETRGLGLGPVAGPLVHWLDGDATLRKSAVWIKTAVGKVTLGKFSLATDGITEIDLSNSGIASRLMSVEPLWSYIGLGGLPIIGGNLLNPTPFHDLRSEVIRYDSPVFGGFTASASWGGGQTLSGDNIWDVALRWAGEGGGFRAAAGIGYRTEEYKTLLAPDQVTISGSASLMHVASGIFGTVGAADQKDNPVFGHIQMIHGKIGWEGKGITSVGATTFYVEAAEHKLPDLSVTSHFYGAGVVQAIDAAAMDVFLSARQYHSDVLSGDATVILGGARIRF